MPDPFLGSDEYDERAHQLYNEGRYDEAIEVLKEGLAVYPDALELLVGLGYARLAREEYAWSRREFLAALERDPDHEDALAGLGEVLLKLGSRDFALRLFDRVLQLGFRDDLDIVLQMGRALFREGLLEQARRYFETAAQAHRDSAEAAACVGYAAHRLSAEADATRWLQRALALDPEHAEARIYLANLLYDRGEYQPSLAEFEKTRPEDHWDELGIWRLIELKRSLGRLPEDDPQLKPWVERLGELGGDADPLDLLLAEIEAAGPDGTLARDPAQLELFGTLVSDVQGMRKPTRAEIHRVTTREGVTYSGTWDDIVEKMRDDDAALAGRSIAEFLARAAARATAMTGMMIPATDAESFIRAIEGAGLVKIVR